MIKYLQAFIEDHPYGWGHEDWLGLIAELEAAGLDVTDPDAVGRELEKERLAAELRNSAVPGLGPKRIDAVVDRFETLWSFRHAEAEEVAEIKTIPGSLAEKVVAAFR